MKRLLFIMMSFFFLQHNCFAEIQQTNQEKIQIETKQLIYNADNFRDPFLPQIHSVKITKTPVEKEMPKVGNKVENKVQLPKLTIQGMVWNTKRPQAIIDGQVFKIGDTVKEAEIIGIDREGVKFLYKDKIFIKKPKLPYMDKTKK
jgi:hypothetical protein